MIVAEPVASAATATIEPDTETKATEGSDDDAPKVSASPSGSVKRGAASSVAVSPTCTVRSGIEPSGSGARLGTMVSKVWVAVSPAGSEAETVIVAEPVASAATATVEPEIETDATEGFDDDAP